jgi:hypothetical protein
MSSQRKWSHVHVEEHIFKTHDASEPKGFATCELRRIQLALRVFPLSMCMWIGGLPKADQVQRSPLGGENFRLACRDTWRSRLAFREWSGQGVVSQP